MNRKLIALATAVVMAVAAMTSSVFAVDETEKTTELQTSSSISTGTIGNISTEEVDLEQQRIIFQREQEFRANLEKAAAVEAQRVVNPPSTKEKSNEPPPKAPDLVELLAELNEAARSSGLDTVAPYRLVTLYQTDREIRQAIIDSGGYSIAGWGHDDGGWTYDDYSDGIYPIGTGTNTEYYYFDGDGYMVHGWQYVTDESAYGFADGYYYFGVPGDYDSGAYYHYGWLCDTEAAGAWYYMDPDAMGRMYHGLLYDDGEFYYLGMPGDDDSGAMYTYGWLKDTEQPGDPWYYFGTDGVAYSGNCPVGNERYYFDYSTCKMAYGWVDGGDDIFFADRTSGALATGNYVFSSDAYVTSMFSATGELLSDTLLSRGTYTNEDGTKTYNRLNVRYYDLIISGGYRYPSIAIEGSAEFNSFESTAIEHVIDFWNDSALVGRVELTRPNTYAAADIAFSLADLSIYGSALTGYRPTGLTLVYNSDGEWSPSIPQGYPQIGTFITGTYVGGLIMMDSVKINQLTESDYLQLLTHEMGHGLGLRHPVELGHHEKDTTVDSFKALMWATYDGGKASDSLEEYDIDEYVKSYP